MHDAYGWDREDDGVMKSDRIYNFMCMNPQTVISDALVRFQTLYEGIWPEP